jgi:hypothetical protein
MLRPLSLNYLYTYLRIPSLSIDATLIIVLFFEEKKKKLCHRRLFAAEFKGFRFQSVGELQCRV